MAEAFPDSSVTWGLEEKCRIILKQSLYLPQMLEVSFAAHKDVDNVILVLLIPLLDPLPPLVDVAEGRLVCDVIRYNDGMGTGVV